MKIFVINLDKDKQRLDFISNSLSSLRLNWERFPAVDFRRVEIYRGKLGWPIFQSGCSIAEIGCALSHWLIWNEVIDRNLQYALVLEDDVHFGGNFLSVIDYIERHHSQLNFDIIKLETMLASIVVGLSAENLDSSTAIVPLLGNHGGTAAYVISQRGCKKMLSLVTHAKRAIDLEMFASKDRSLAVFQIQPAPCIQDFLLKNSHGFASNISGTRLEEVRKSKIVEALKNSLRPLALKVASIKLHRNGRKKIRSTFFGY